jgi:hypothetical protein
MSACFETIALISSPVMIFHPFSKKQPFSGIGLPRRSTTTASSKAMYQLPNPTTFGPAHDGILRIEFAKPGERTRKIISRSNFHPTGRYPSFRMKRSMHWDSPHELNAYQLLDSNPAVTEFIDQPCIIHYRLDGKDHKHYPDTMVRTAECSSLWEIKTKADALSPEVAARSHLMAKCLPAFGYQYAVVLAEDLWRQPRLKNARLVIRRGRKPLTFELLELARRLFESTDSLLWHDVQAGRYEPLAIRHICRLILDNYLFLDFDQQISPITAIKKVHGGKLIGVKHE